MEVARILASVYGHTLDPIVYTQGVAISGRLRLAQLEPDGPDPSTDIAALVERYAAGGVERVVDAQAGSSTLAGLVWGQELSEATGDPRHSQLLQDAANRFRSGAPGEPPPPSSPDFRVEDMFCNSAVLGRAFQMSGESRYLDLMTSLLVDCGTQQDNGLFWHCRNAPYFWSRGNGFAALGFAEALTYLPESHRHRSTILEMHHRHLQTLARHQQPSGMFLELVDFPVLFRSSPPPARWGTPWPGACVGDGWTLLTSQCWNWPGRGWRNELMTPGTWWMPASVPACRRAPGTTCTDRRFSALMTAAAAWPCGLPWNWNGCAATGG